MLWRRAAVAILSLLDAGLEVDLRVATRAVSPSVWAQALSLLCFLRLRGLRTDIVARGAAASAARRKRWQVALQTVADVPEDGMATTTVAANVALDAAHSWQRAADLLRKFSASGVRVDATSSSAVIKGFRVWSRALGIWSTTGDYGLETNVVQTSSALAVLSRGHEWTRASSMLASSRSASQQVDVIAVGAVIAAQSRFREWAASASLMTALSARGILPNSEVVSASMDSGETKQGWALCICLLVALSAWALQPHGRALLSATSALATGRAWQRGLGLLQSMPLRCLEGSTEQANAAAAGCRSSNWQRCLSLVDLGEGFGRGTAAAACAQGYDWISALWLLWSMPGRSSSIVVNAVLSATARALRWKPALEVLLARNMETDAVSFDTTIASCTRTWKRTLDLLATTELLRLHAGEEAVSSALDSSARQAAWIQAVDLLGHLQERRCLDAAALDAAAQAMLLGSPSNLPAVLAEAAAAGSAAILTLGLRFAVGVEATLKRDASSASCTSCLVFWSPSFDSCAMGSNQSCCCDKKQEDVPMEMVKAQPMETYTGSGDLPPTEDHAFHLDMSSFVRGAVQNQLEAMKVLEVDTAIVRGISVANSLRASGRLWQKSPVDMDERAKSKLWEKSEPVDRFDVFFSHTWRTPGRWKVLSLLFQYGWPFTLTCWACVAAFVFVLGAFGWLPTPLTFRADVLGFQKICPFAPWVYLSGVFTAVLSLFLSPYWLFFCHSPKCFLDVVSINQMLGDTIAYNVQFRLQPFKRCIGPLIDAANIALPRDDDLTEAKAARDALAEIVSITKQTVKASVVLISSEHGYPFKLAKAGLNLVDIKNIIIAPEVP
eukprot:s4952_g1.t2